MLTVKNLEAGYAGGFHIRDISLRIGGGEFAGIIGPNGSGKTTLLRALTKSLKPEKGTVNLDSESISELSFKEAARRVAVVPQTVEAGFITVGDYVLMGRLPHYRGLQFFEGKKDRVLADKYMELTGVAGLRDKYVSEISGGERQLAAIARALTQETGLLLLDEPTSHLDIKHQVKILDLLRKMNASGMTVVCVLHDLNLAAEYCSRLFLMNGGRLYKTGEPKEVMDYRTIEEVYGTVVVVAENPVSGKPLVVPVPGEAIKRTGLKNGNP